MGAPYDVGDTYQFTTPTVVDANGTAANSALVAAAVTLPDGSMFDASASITNPPAAAGVYKGSYAITQAGRHKLRVVGSGGSALAWAFTDVFDAFPADPLFIVSLEDARQAVRKSASDASDDAELRLYMAAVTTVVEAACGPQTLSSATITRSGGKSAIIVPSSIVSVTSATENGTVLLAGSDYTVDYEAGLVFRGNQLQPFPWLPGHLNVTITVTAGESLVPANVRLAARIILRHLWLVDHQATSGPALGDEAASEDTIVLAGYAVPNRAAGLLSPSHNAIPGFA